MVLIGSKAEGSVKQKSPKKKPKCRTCIEKHLFKSTMTVMIRMYDPD